MLTDYYAPLFTIGIYLLRRLEAHTCQSGHPVLWIMLEAQLYNIKFSTLVYPDCILQKALGVIASNPIGRVFKNYIYPIFMMSVCLFYFYNEVITFNK